LLETKLARNTKFWNGLKKQLPTYLKAERITRGYFIVVCYDDKDFDRVKDIHAEVDAACKTSGFALKAIVVDASRGKPSASRI
jgi:hypothetical protein